MSSVDWRNRWGWPWLTNIKDQGGCGSCYSFSGTGLVEAMTRIEHCVWSLRSEGDVGDAISFLFGAHSKCGGGSPEHVLQWIQANGIADPGCWSSPNSPKLAMPTPDRLGRTIRLDKYHSIGGPNIHNDMKTWIELNGPVAVCFACYPEFDDACKNDSIYIYSNPDNKPSDGHCVLIVGYDDAKAAWLVRNSWGTGWGTHGYGWFGLLHWHLGELVARQCRQRWGLGEAQFVRQRHSVERRHLGAALGGGRQSGRQRARRPRPRLRDGPPHDATLVA